MEPRQMPDRRPVTLPRLPEYLERKLVADVKAELTELTGGRTRKDFIRCAKEDPAGAARVTNNRVSSWFNAEAFPSEVKPACRAGCSMCCHIVPDVTHGEVLLLQEAIAALPPEDRADIAEKVPTAASKVRGAGSGEAAWPLRCPLLGNDGNCRVYDARPAACRTYTSTSRDRCRDTLLSQDGTIEMPFVSLVAMTTRAAFRQFLGTTKTKPLPVALDDERIETEKAQ